MPTQLILQCTQCGKEVAPDDAYFPVSNEDGFLPLIHCGECSKPIWVGWQLSKAYHDIYGTYPSFSWKKFELDQASCYYGNPPEEWMQNREMIRVIRNG